MYLMKCFKEMNFCSKQTERKGFRSKRTRCIGFIERATYTVAQKHMPCLWHSTSTQLSAVSSLHATGLKKLKTLEQLDNNDYVQCRIADITYKSESAQLAYARVWFVVCIDTVNYFGRT